KALIQQHGAELSSQLQAHHRSIFPPEAEKTIRHFSPTEAASLIGIHEGYLRQVASEGKGVCPSITNGRRSYSVDAIQEIRKQLDQGARGGRRYLPHRGSGVRHHFVVRTQFLQNQYFSARPHKREYHLI